MGRFLVPFLKSCHFFVFVLGGSLQHHVRSIYLYSSKTEHLQKILYGFKFRRPQLYGSTFESLVSTQICLQGAGSRCPTEPEKAANCQTAKPRGPRKPPTAVVQLCNPSWLTFLATTNQAEESAIYAAAWCWLIFLKIAIESLFGFCEGEWCGKWQWTDGMGPARQMIPEVFFMPEHVFLSYLGVKQIP